LPSSSSGAWIHTLVVLVACGTRVATILAVFQCLFQYTLYISDASKNRSINSNYFWINYYNILKFGTICLLLCIFLDCLDTINLVLCVFFILKWCGYLCLIVRLFFGLRLLFFFWTLSWCMSYVLIYLDWHKIWTKWVKLIKFMWIFGVI
jgi:hypothetical protein